MGLEGRGAEVAASWEGGRHGCRLWSSGRLQKAGGRRQKTRRGQPAPAQPSLPAPVATAQACARGRRAALEPADGYERRGRSLRWSREGGRWRIVGRPGQDSDVLALDDQQQRPSRRRPRDDHPSAPASTHPSLGSPGPSLGSVDTGWMAGLAGVGKGRLARARCRSTSCCLRTGRPTPPRSPPARRQGSPTAAVLLPPLCMRYRRLIIVPRPHTPAPSLPLPQPVPRNPQLARAPKHEPLSLPPPPPPPAMQVVDRSPHFVPGATQTSLDDFLEAVRPFPPPRFRPAVASAGGPGSAGAGGHCCALPRADDRRSSADPFDAAPRRPPPTPATKFLLSSAEPAQRDRRRRLAPRASLPLPLPCALGRLAGERTHPSRPCSPS